jgi:hypothetical protein
VNREGCQGEPAAGKKRPTHRIRAFTVRDWAEVSGVFAHHGALRYRVGDNAVRVGWRAVDI